MKPLLSLQIHRGQVVTEWIPATDQATDAGRRDFWARQQERIRREQPVTHVVLQITQMRRR